MYKVDYAIEINRPLEQVFEFVSNYENDPMWRSEVQKMRNNSGFTGVGSTSSEISKVLGRRLETLTTVIEYIPNQKISSQSLSGPVPIKSQRIVETNGGNTRFRYSLEMDTSKVFFYRFLGPYLINWYQKRIEKYMHNLKQALEARQFQREAV